VFPDQQAAPVAGLLLWILMMGRAIWNLLGFEDSVVRLLVLG
jgi:hypothetical protein